MTLVVVWRPRTCHSALFGRDPVRRTMRMRLELTRRTDYAIRASLVLARNPGVRMSAAHIARRTHTPPRFAGQVMLDLVRAGIVNAAVGRTGGYSLDASPDAISVLRIVEAVEGDQRRQHCSLRGGPCHAEQPCEVHHVFSGAQEAFLEQLAATSLAQLAGNPANVRGAATRTASGASRGKRPPARAAAG